MATGGARGVRSGQDRGAAGKVAEEAVIRVFVILLDILIVVLLEKTTHEPELRSAAVTDGQERAGSNGKGPKPNRQMGDNLRKIIVEETVAACDACGADIDGPVDRERRTTSCSRSSSAAPRSRNARIARPGAGSPTTSRAVRHRHSGPRPCWSPRCCPCAVPLVQAISGIKLSEASAMLSRCVMGGGRRGAPPATPDVDDFGSTASGFMSWDPDVQVPAPQARARDRPVLQGRPGPRTWQCSHQLCGSHLLRELTFVVEATARLMKSLLREVCHKVNKSASKTLNDAGRKRYRTIRAQGTARHPDERKTWTQVRRAQPARTSRETRKPALHRRPRCQLHQQCRRTEDQDGKGQGVRMLPLHAKAWCRGSSYLTSMAALGYNHHVATQIALDGKAADIINEHYDQSEPN